MFLETLIRLTPHIMQSIHDSVTINKTRDLFDTDLLIQGNDNDKINTPMMHINVYKKCITELVLLDGKNVLSLFDTGSTLNLISESVIKSSVYLSIMPILKCPDYRIRNTITEIIVNQFIELCFRLKENYILHTIALVPDFGSVKFLLSTPSMTQLNSVIDIASKKISVRKKSFIFRIIHHCKIKEHDTIKTPIKCILPKSLRNGEFFSKSFRPYSGYLLFFLFFFIFFFTGTFKVLKDFIPLINVIWFMFFLFQ